MPISFHLFVHMTCERKEHCLHFASSFSSGKKPDSSMLDVRIIYASLAGSNKLARHYLYHQEHDNSVTAVMMAADTTASSGDDEAGTTTTVATTTTIAATTTTDGFEWTGEMTTPPPTSTSQQQQQRTPIAKEQRSNPRPYAHPPYSRPTSPPKVSGPRSMEANCDIPTSHKKQGKDHVQTEHGLKATALANSPTVEVEETRNTYWNGGGFKLTQAAAQNSQRKFWGTGLPCNSPAPAGSLVHTPPKGYNQAKKKHRVGTHASPTPPAETKSSEFFGPSPSWSTKSDGDGDSVGLTTPVFCQNTNVFCQNTNCPRFYTTQKTSDSDTCEICLSYLSTHDDTPLPCGESPRPGGKYS